MLLIGDDPADNHHDVEVHDEAGRTLATARIPQGTDGVARLRELVVRHGGADLDVADVLVGTRSDRGPWVQALLATGYRVYAISPGEVARFSELRDTTGRTGRARTLAHMVRTDRSRLLPAAGTAPPPPRTEAPRTLATATVIGTGLIGTSVALALTAQGVTVHLTDRDPAQAAAAQALGAGRTEPAAGPVDLAVIAVPPDHVAPVLADCQRLDVARSYTDVASVKSGPWQAVTDAGLDTGRYLGGHPMAGRERSGPYAARADLFEGRPWVLTPRPDTHPATLAAVRELIALCGAVPVEMTPGNHDRAVALVSHAPHVIAAMTAARLEHADPGALALTGQGLRDTTRVAGGDPALWREILAANAPRVADVLQDVAADLGEMIAALRARDPDRVHGLLAHGHAGHARIPGKHGGTPAPYDVIRVHVGDRPGELARLLAAAHATGINIEDLTIDHTATAAGVAELQVAAPSTARLLRTLTAYGWRYS